MPPTQDFQEESTDELCQYYSAGWEESDDTSLLQLSHANHQVKQPTAAQPEDMHSEEPVASGAEPAPARNVAGQNQIVHDINLVKMEKLVSDMERSRGDDDEPDADSGNSNADVDDASGASGSWSNNEKTALETLKSALQLQFIPFLDAEHSDDTEEYHARKAVHQLCIKHNVEDNAAVAQAHDFLETKRDKHKACRQSQKSWNAYKSLAIGGSSCAGASDIQDMHEVYGQHEQLADLMQASKMHAQAYANLAPAGVKRDCAQDQEAYEQQWCAWRASKDDSCTQLQRCFDAADLDDLKTKLETRARNRRNIWHTVTKLQCRISHLLSTFAGADEDTLPDDTSADDTSAVTIDDISDFNTDDNCDEVTDMTRYVLRLDVPQHHSCSNAGDAAVDVIAPGGSTGSDWIAQKYSAGEGWSTTVHVVPATCQTSCPAGTVTAPPALHEGCADDPAGCGFYNAHPNACGHYDTGSDVQSADCCACAASPGSEGFEPTEWTLILQYGDSGYIPDTSAVGALNENEKKIAKLSDAAINALPSGGDAEYDYYMLTSESVRHSVTGAYEVIKSTANERDTLFMRVQGGESYSDSSATLGFSAPVTFCSEALFEECTGMNEIQGSPRWSVQNNHQGEPLSPADVANKQPGLDNIWTVKPQDPLGNTVVNYGCYSWRTGYEGRLCETFSGGGERRCWAAKACSANEGSNPLRRDLKMYKKTA